MLQKAVAPALYEIVFSPRQQAVYVASAGGWGEGAGPARILRLDPETLEITAEIPLPGKGFGLALDDAADRLYVGDVTEAAITVIDTAAGQVVATIRLTGKVTDAEGRQSFPFHCRELALDPGANRLYAPCHSFAGSVLCVIDTISLEVVAKLPGFGFVAAGIVTDPARSRLFVSNAQGQVATFDTARQQITATAETAGDQLMNLALDTGGQRLFATDQGHDFFNKLWVEHLPGYQRRGSGAQVLVLDSESGADLGRIPTAAGPLAVWHDAGRRQLWVTERVGQSVSVFDSETFALIRRFSFDGHPNSIAPDPARGVVCVTIKATEGAGPGSPESVARLSVAG